MRTAGDGGNLGDDSICAGSAQVSFIDLKRIQVSIDSQLTKHKLIVGGTYAGSAQVSADNKSKRPANASGNAFGHLHLKGFREILSLAENLSCSFVGLAECALISNVDRIRELHPDRQWTTEQIKSFMQVPEAVKEFARGEGIDLETAVLDALAELVAALEPALSRNQKQYYGAIKVLVDLYAEGKELPNVAEAVRNIPKPTAENKCMFVLLQKFLEAVAKIPQISKSSSVEDCIDAYGPLTDVLEHWPMEVKGSEMIVGSAWVKWGSDLKELSLDSSAVYQ